MRRGHPFEGVIGDTWDSRADAWEEVARSDAFVRLRDVLMEVAAATADDNVLDLGSGTGLLTLAAARKACRVIALDASAEMLARTARNGPNWPPSRGATLRRARWSWSGSRTSPGSPCWPGDPPSAARRRRTCVAGSCVTGR